MLAQTQNRRGSAKWNKTSTHTSGQSNVYDYSGHVYPRSNEQYLHPDTQSTNAISILTENMNRINLQPNAYHPQPSTKTNTQTYDGGIPIGTTMQQAFMHNGQLLFTGSQYHNATQAMAPYGMYGHYVTQPIMPYNQQMMGGQSPLPSTWAPSSRTTSGELPSLVTPRRAGSASSQEIDVPGTPYTQFNGYGGEFQGQAGVAVADRSPHSIYGPAWSTPSPTQTNFTSKHHQKKTSISNRLSLLIVQEPAIPRAIPAPYSPVKPLDRSLENPHGITNVYIRGLLPETTDDLLYKLAVRFGDIISSKSIIDHTTGLCKGFGFVKFHNFRDAEDCIRGFHHLGYESSFARESFYSQLKKLHDDDNTNLYVSNLPKDMNEHELSAIFGRFKVCSSRILRDTAGNGRGVGFARFESRQICEEIIKDYNNTPIRKGDGEEHLIQIRFADTPDQKHLKQQTAAARQYRTAEYESQTKGRSPFISPARGPGGLGGSRPIDQEFESYMTMATGHSADHRQDGNSVANDRFSTVSSHITTPKGSIVNVNFPTQVSPLKKSPEKRSPIKRSPEKRSSFDRHIKHGAARESSGEASCSDVFNGH